MARKNKKGGKNPNPNSGASGGASSNSNVPSNSSQPTTSSSQQATNKAAKVKETPNTVPVVSTSSNQNKPATSSQQATHKPAKSKETPNTAPVVPTSSNEKKLAPHSQKSSNQSTNQKKEPNSSGGPSKALNEATNKIGAKKRGKAGKGNTQQNQKGKPEPEVPVKAKAPKPIAQQPPVSEEQIKATKTTHAPAAIRLKFSILFKQETAFYVPDIIQTPIVNHPFRLSCDVKSQGLEISKSIDQLVAQDKINDIVTTITSILDKNNPLLINYDILLYSLAKCLCLVRQDPKTKLPSPTIIEFRTKILALAVERVADSSAERLLQFVFYLLNFSKKSLHNSAIRQSLQKWYMLKPADQLVLLCAKGSAYMGVTHAIVLKLLHFNVPAVSVDSQLALLAIIYGFGLISDRVTTGSFPATVKIPPFLNQYDCYQKADDKVKALIKDIALVRSPTSTQKPVAVAVKAHSLRMQDVSSAFHKSYKVNTAALETSNQRQCLQSMHRLRLQNILASTDEAKVEEVTTVETYVKRLREGPTSDPPIHPAEVMGAYAEYVLAPQRIAEKWKIKVGSKENEQLEIPLSIREPDPSIVKVLQEMYTKSFENLKKHDLKMVVCIDLQDEFMKKSCREYEPLRGYQECMLVLQCLFHMVENSSNLKVVAFKKREFKPVIRLKKHTDMIKPEEVEPDDEGDGAGLENLTDLGGSEEEEEEVIAENSEEVKEEGSVEKSLVNDLETTWQHYRKQVRGTRGITVHKLFSLAEKWHQFLPDVFVVICLQENLTLYKAHILFSDYVEKSKKKNAKLLVISPCSHLESARKVHRRNMLHIVGYDPKITHIIEDFLANKMF